MFKKIRNWLIPLKSTDKPSPGVSLRSSGIHAHADLRKKTRPAKVIVDDSVLEIDDETGIDPYNTGEFDRSRNWDTRFRK